MDTDSDKENNSDSSINNTKNSSSKPVLTKRKRLCVQSDSEDERITKNPKSDNNLSPEASSSVMINDTNNIVAASNTYSSDLFSQEREKSLPVRQCYPLSNKSVKSGTLSSSSSSEDSGPKEFGIVEENHSDSTMTLLDNKKNCSSKPFSTKRKRLCVQSDSEDEM